MPRSVKPDRVRDLQAARIARTERAIMDAARDLFIAQGYVPTTLAQVAEHAGVATRTVFVRFDSKVELFRRVIERALVGDDEPIDVEHRPRTKDAMTAATLAQRLTALVDVTVGVMQRAGALFDVAAQAEGLEPELAASWQAGRRATAELARTFCKRAAADGLLPQHANLKLLAITADLYICADTMVHLRRTRNSTAREYRRWLAASLAAVTADSDRGFSPPGDRDRAPQHDHGRQDPRHA